MTYCLQCHGSDALGNGPMAEMLAIATPDLTILTAQNDGEFPLEWVVQKIDGRHPMLAHGGEMPIFGPALEGERNVALRVANGQPILLSLPLADLAVFLESIQGEQ